MSINDFITKYTNQPNVGDTDLNKGQCVGLIEIWLDENGLSPDHIWGNAIDLYSNAGLNDKIFSRGTNWPAPEGAIVTFGAPYGRLDDGTYAGHTGVSLGDGRLFEQNDPDGSTPHLKAYNINGYIGYITATQLTQGGSMTCDPANTLHSTDSAIDYSIQVFGPGGDIPARRAWARTRTIQSTLDEVGSDPGSLWIQVRDGQLVPVQQVIDLQAQVADLQAQLANQPVPPPPVPTPEPTPVPPTAPRNFFQKLINLIINGRFE